MSESGSDVRTLYELRDVRFREVFRIGRIDIRTGVPTLVRGRSGCGKTTLLKMLNRMCPPDAGTITFRGDDLSMIDPVSLRRQAVMLPQSPILFGGTVGDELRIGRTFAGLPPADRQQIRRALDEVQLQKDPDESPARFSGGEQQRLCLARVLLMDPRVLLLDEPTVGLDGESEIVIFERLRTWQAIGRTVIAATHSERAGSLGVADVCEFRAGEVVVERAQL